MGAARGGGERGTGAVWLLLRQARPHPPPPPPYRTRGARQAATETQPGFGAPREGAARPPLRHPPQPQPHRLHAPPSLATTAAVAHPLVPAGVFCRAGHRRRHHSHRCCRSCLALDFPVGGECSNGGGCRRLAWWGRNFPSPPHDGHPSCPLLSSWQACHTTLSHMVATNSPRTPRKPAQ